MSQKHKVGELLLRAGLIDEFQLRSALGEQKRWGRRLGQTLVKMGFMEEDDLIRVLAEQLKLPIAHLDGKRIHADVLGLVPLDFAEKHMVLPLFSKRDGGVDTLYLGTEDPTDLAVLDDLSFRTGMRIKPVLVSPSELCEGIDRFYRDRRLDLSVSPDVAPSLETTTASPAEICLPPEPALDLDAPFLAPEPEAAPPVEASRPPAAENPAEVAEQASNAILQAVTQLLIEKGVLGREELFTRVRELREVDRAKRG